MNSDSNKPIRLLSRYVQFAEKHTALCLAAFGLLAVACVIAALRLELHTDFAELLPSNHPSVLALRRIAGRQKSATNLVMLVHSPDAAENRAFVEAMRPELEKMIPHVFTEIQWRPDQEMPAYGAKWKWLYADLKDLEEAENLVDRLISKHGKLAVDLLGDPQEELRSLNQKLERQIPPQKDMPYFEAQINGTPYLGVMFWRNRDGIATQGDHDTLVAVQDTVAKIRPQRFHAKMVVEYTGHIAQAIDEQNGIREDLTIATTVCITLVMLAIYLYFQRFALLLVIGAPAALGLFVALAIASFTVRYLNINTAFLISIIIGNGINSPIILLARYGEERKAGRGVVDALSISTSACLSGTLVAMLGASISYGCLLLTGFRGFNQFGFLGGIGILLVWIFSFLMVPPLVIFGEQIRPGILTPRGSIWQTPLGLWGRLATKRPALLAIAGSLFLLASLLPLVRYLRDPLEWNFDNLRTDETSSQRLWPVMEGLGMGNVGAGYIGNDGVLLVDHPEQADPVAEAMRRQDAAKGPQHVLKEVRTIHSVLPADQEQKLEILQRIGRKIDRHIGMIDENQQRREVTDWRPPDYLRVLQIQDLPRIVKEAFTETDGHQGRLIGIDADNTTFYNWNGHDLLRISKALTVTALGKEWVAASASTIFAGMLETIIQDGPIVTAAALLGVIVLVLFAFRLSGALPVLASLAVGMAWLGGVAGATHLKINFMNFVAIPITLGVGTDYAANIWARLRREGIANLTEVIRETGSAVALCSTTTIIGYSSLLLSHNRALRSFGKLADWGEISCLLAALLVLPVWVHFTSIRRNKAAPTTTSSIA